MNLLARIALFGTFTLLLVCAWIRVTAATVQLGPQTCVLQGAYMPRSGAYVVAQGCGGVWVCARGGTDYSAARLVVSRCLSDRIRLGDFE